jgi:hypothetical protein
VTETQTLEGLVVPADAWTPEEAANHVSEAWQNAVDSIVETGRRLNEAKRRVGHGNWLPTVDLLPFSERTAQVLMRVAQHPDLANPQHVADLPASWGTLGVLAQLPPGEIPKRIQAGEITPDLDRNTAQSWVSTYAASRQEYLNAYNQAVDGLRAALSYAKTYSPPVDIPDNYLAVSEFVEWTTALLEIAQGWDV